VVEVAEQLVVWAGADALEQELAGALVGAADQVAELVLLDVELQPLEGVGVEVVGEHGVALRGGPDGERAHAAHQVAEHLFRLQLGEHARALLAEPRVPVDLREVETQLHLALADLGLKGALAGQHLQAHVAVDVAQHLRLVDHQLQLWVLVEDGLGLH